MKDFNWRLVVLSAIGAAVGINLLIFLLGVLLFSGGIFQDKTVIALLEYLIPFALFSPLVASLISCAVVTRFSRTKKILHVILSTLITFALTTGILFYITSPFALAHYTDFERRIDKVKE